MKVLILGSGSYVFGEDQNHGTIFPALIEFSKSVDLDISVATRSEFSANNVKERASFLLKICPSNGIKSLSVVPSLSDLSALSTYIQSHSFDCCIIALPDHVHYDYCKFSIDHKLPFLIVKPFTLSFDHANTLVQLSQQSRIPGFVEFHKRFDRQARIAKQSIFKSSLGNLLYSFTEYAQQKKNPLTVFQSWSSQTNIFSYLAVHYVDLFYFLTGFRPIRVCATAQSSFLSRHGISTYDSIQCLIQWSGQGQDVTQVICCNWIESDLAPFMSRQSMHLVGTNGRLDLTQDNRGVSLLTDEHSLSILNPDFSRLYQTASDSRFEGYGIDSIISFLLHIQGLPISFPMDCLCPIEEALISTSVLDSVGVSLSQSSSWISIGQAS